MNERIREKILQFLPKVGYPLFYVFCFFVFLSWTFPYDRLKERIVLAFNEQQRLAGSAQELHMEDLSSSWITGVRATGVRLVSAATEPGAAPTEIKIDQAKARISVLGLLVGHKNVSYSIKAFDGELDGHYSQGTDSSFDVSLEDVALSSMSMVRDLLGVPVDGKINGKANLEMPESKVSKSNGSFSVDISDIAVGDGKAKLKGMVALPRMNIGTLTLTAEAKEGVLKITKLTAGGKDLELQGEGRIQLREKVMDSTCDLNLRFKVNDAYRTKSEDTKSLFGAPGSSAPALLELDPKVKQSKRPDGFYAWHVRGPLSRPDFDPVGAGGVGAGSRPAGAGRTLPAVP